MVSSLDGIIAKPDNSVSWFETSHKHEKGVESQNPEDFLKTIDCYIMGSHTYEHALELSKSYGWPYGDTPTFVLTHRNLKSDKPNIQFYSGDLLTLVNTHLKPNYNNVWIAGGAQVAQDFIQSKLANEIRLTIIPIILGEGKKLFENISQQQELQLNNLTAYKNGLVELHYEIKC